MPAKDGAYMAGDRRMHRTERSKWRLTFRRLVGDALAAPQTATLVTECLRELPGHQGCLDLAVEVGAELPPRARGLLSERARISGDAP